MDDCILIIDDSPEVLRSLVAMVEGHFRATCAADVDSALGAVRQAGPFTAILCEPALADGRGLELLAGLLLLAPDTPRVVLTASRDLDFVTQALCAGEPFRLLRKPLRTRELLDVLKEAGQRYEARRQERELEEELVFARDCLEDLTSGLEARITTQFDDLRILHRFALDLNAAESLDDIARLAAQACFSLLRGHGVHVQLWDDDSSHGNVRADAGPEMSARMHREALCTPDGQVGEIVVDREGRGGRPLSIAGLEALVMIARPTAVAVANVLRRRERDQAQQATILALARLAERRDSETGQHIERVSRYCELIARGLRERGYYAAQITERFIDHLVRSAPLHDIGKVGIPDAILLKPGKLSPSEWEIMKTHAAIGAATLDEVIAGTRNPGYLAMGRDIAACHHERWDGKGYPAGLSGEAIPLSARILALADVYDALTSERPYKRAWTQSEAIEHVRTLAGGHIDPHVVEVFLAAAEEADQIRIRHADVAEREPAEPQASSRS